MTASGSEELLQRLTGVGCEEGVGSNTPFLLDDEDAVWVVAQGKVEVFLVSLEHGEPAGARRHCFTSGPGDAVFGMDVGHAGGAVGYLAVGLEGTRLVRLTLDEFQRTAADPSLQVGVAGMVERWVGELSRGAWHADSPRPRTEVQLVPNSPARLQNGERARAQRGVVWADHELGESLFISLETTHDDGPAPPIPLTQHTFIQAVGEVSLSVASTEEALAVSRGWEGLARFHAVVLRCQDLNVRLAKVDERNRLQSRKLSDRRSLSDAFGLLAGVFARTQGPTVLVDDDNAILAAARLIGRRLGLQVTAPAKLPDGRTYPDPVAALAEASRIRTREVVLKGAWWSDEPTPLLAFLEEGHRPVAILPESGTSYLHNPTDGSVTRVTEALAEQLEPYAFTFYRPLPDGPISPWRILRFSLAGTGPDLARLGLFGVIGGLLGVLPPHFMGLLVGNIIPEASEYRLLQLSAILLVITVTSVCLGLFQGLAMLRLEVRMGASLQPAIWDRLLALPMRFFRRYASGDLVLRASAIDQIRQVLTGAAMGTVMIGLFSVFYVAQLLYYSLDLGLIAIGVAGMALVVSSGAAYLKLRVERQALEIEGHLSSLVLQMLTGLAKLRVAGAEARTLAEWARRFTVQVRLGIRADRIDAVVGTALSGLPILGSMGLFFAVTGLTERALEAGNTPPITVGTFVAFMAAFGILLSQMVQLGSTALSILTVIPLFERAGPILAEPKEINETKSAVSVLSGKMEISHVSFRYQEEGPLVINDVSIDIPAESYIALVGASGSGKSTLLRLMLGLESPTSGTIYYDGRDLSELDARQLRRTCGIVVQNGLVRQGSIYDNIVGTRPLTESEVWEAVRMAGFDEDISQMPMGMHTVLQQGGGTLSGGQRQRLMIAQAVVTRPRILFFDEATSALDNRTQAIVTESLKDLQATRVVIAHRMSTIRDADRIYVLARGMVVQAGVYGELMSQPGTFSDLITRQLN